MNVLGKFIFLVSLAITFGLVTNDEVSADYHENLWSYGRIAWVAQGPNGDSDIMVWDANTEWEAGSKHKVHIKECGEESDEIHPALSNNGKFIAFATNCATSEIDSNGHWWIAVYDLESPDHEWHPITVPTGSTGLGHNSLNPTWNPSDSKLAFDSDVDDPRKIYFVDVWDAISRTEAGENPDFHALTEVESWDPDWAPDGNVMALMTPKGPAKLFTDNAVLRPLAGHSGSKSDNNFSPIAISKKFGDLQEPATGHHWNFEGLIEDSPNVNELREAGLVNCDPRAAVFAYSTDGSAEERHQDNGDPKIVVTCQRGMDPGTPEHVTSNAQFGNFLSGAGNGMLNGSYPVISPDRTSIAFLSMEAATGDRKEIVVLRYEGYDWHMEGFGSDDPNIYNSFGGGPKVWMNQPRPPGTKLTSPFSWSHYHNPLAESDSSLALEVGAIGLSVDVGGGVNQIFGSQETMGDQYDKQIQLEINRINSYRKELDFWLESELQRLQFDKDQWEANNVSRVEEENQRRIEETKRGWESGISDNKRQMEYELKRYDEDSKYALQEREQNLENFLNNDRPQRIEEMEQSQAWQIQDADRRRENDKAELVRWRDENISNSQRYWKEETDYIKMYYQDLINDAIHRDDQSAVNDHMRERDHNIEDYEEYLQNELNGHNFSYDDELTNRQRNWAREDQDRVRDFESEKQNVMQDLDRIEEGFQREIDNYLEEQARNRESMRSQYEMNILNQQEQAAMEIESAEAEARNRLEMLELERERMQAQWQMKEDQLYFEYESQQADFDRQVDEVMFNAEMDKQRFEMDQEQMEMEMQMMQDEISSREQDTDFMFNNNMESLRRDAEERMHEIERRKQEEGWSEEEYSNALAQYDEWYFNREFEIQSEYDQDMRDIQFDQRQYENFQSVVEQNEIYDDGARGFFGNPVAGSIRQGGFEENLEDPGFLAMVGIIITVGTTLFQVVRGK